MFWINTDNQYYLCISSFVKGAPHPSGRKNSTATGTFHHMLFSRLQVQNFVPLGLGNRRGLRDVLRVDLQVLQCCGKVSQHDVKVDMCEPHRFHKPSMRLCDKGIVVVP